MNPTLCKVLFAAFVMFTGSHADAAAPEWRVISIDNRDYLSLGNIASFYQLQAEQNPVDQHWILRDSRTRVETCGNPREIYINGVKQWLALPLLTQDGEILVSRLDLAKTLEPSLRPTLINNLAPFHTVVLDAGHGGQDGGSRNVAGQEKEYTMAVIRSLRKSLQSKGFRVILTRNNDEYLPLEARADFANHVSDAVFVSVHFNSSGDPAAKGFEVFTMTPCGAVSTSDLTATTPDQFRRLPGNDYDNASLALASCVQHSVLGHLSESDRGIKRARFAVLRLTHAPAILIEGGFLSNGIESKEINDPGWREKLAESVAVGIRSYQTLAGYKQPPKLMADYRDETLPGPATITGSVTRAANPAAANVRVTAVSNVQH